MALVVDAQGTTSDSSAAHKDSVFSLFNLAYAGAQLATAAAAHLLDAAAAS